MVTIDPERARLVALGIKPLVTVINEFLYRDPQFRAIKQLVDAAGSEAALLVVLNALISYRLPVTGEEYWLRFSVFFGKSSSEPILDRFQRFLNSFNWVYAREAKLSRIEKILNSSLARRLIENPTIYCSKPRSLIAELAEILGSSRDSKTIVFAAKMYMYFCIAKGFKIEFEEIPIPVDYRNSLLALTSCIVRDCNNIALTECASRLTTGIYANEVRKAWEVVCREVEIPCLLLDVFTWLFTGIAIKCSFDPLRIKETLRREYEVDLPLETIKLLVECAGKMDKRV